MAKKRIHPRVKSKGVQLRLKGLADKVALVENPQMRNDFPLFRAGDTVKVHAKIKEGDKERIQIFEGLVIGLSNKGGSKSFTVRKISHGVGVERIFMFSSPKVAKIEIAQAGKVRRAKLYYIRELEGKAAKVEREVETQTATQQRESAKKS